MTDGSSLPSAHVNEIIRELASEPERPLEPVRPVHVVYGGAHLFDARTIAKLGERARTAMDAWGGDAAAFGRAVGVNDPDVATEVAARVRAKLLRRPVEAFCIDFEDGFGSRSEQEEDAEVIRASSELAKTSAPDTSIGVRVKALGGATSGRAIRTLDRFLTHFAQATDGELRPNFSVTLPKVGNARHVSALVELLERLEAALGIARPVDIELMIETPPALLGPSGPAIAPLIEAARGRAVALHLGAYDFTAELGVSAGHQRLDHPYCDLARMLLKLTTFGTGVGVSDGATTTLPVAPKGASPTESTPLIHRAWSIHAENVRRAIDAGIWQGWDLHPAQLPARYGALFGYFIAQRPQMTTRLRNFVERATRASRIGEVFDDAATAQGILSFFARGLACGALDEADVRATSLAPSELTSSFSEIARRRRGAQP